MILGNNIHISISIVFPGKFLWRIGHTFENSLLSMFFIFGIVTYISLYMSQIHNIRKITMITNLLDTNQ